MGTKEDHDRVELSGRGSRDLVRSGEGLRPDSTHPGRGDHAIAARSARHLGDLRLSYRAVADPKELARARREGRTRARRRRCRASHPQWHPRDRSRRIDADCGRASPRGSCKRTARGCNNARAACRAKSDQLRRGSRAIPEQSGVRDAAARPTGPRRHARSDRCARASTDACAGRTAGLRAGTTRRTRSVAR